MSVKRSISVWLAALVAALALAAQPAAGTPAVAADPPSSQTPAPAPRPAIWLLADDDTRIYLFGTVHILPADLVWRSAELEEIVARADELVMEIGESPDEENPASLLAPMMMGKSLPILARVSPERREALREMIEASGLPVEAYDQMHSWAAAFMLSAASIREAYADPEDPDQPLSGVEDSLRADFERAQRPISGVETVEEQLGFFNAMSLRSQRAFLESMVDSYLDGEAEFDPEEAGWVSGDIEGIAAEMAEMPPELFEILLTRRNAAWTDWLIARLDRPGEVLFAVGAGHLAGRDSVQSMLEARGFRVARLH